MSLEPVDLLKTRLADVRDRLAAAARRVGREPSDVTLVAVTKTVSAAVAALLPSLGINDLAENRPQSLWEKAAAIPTAHWHMIGHMQRNKIDKSLPMLARVHSVDSLRVLEAYDAALGKVHQNLPAMLEVNCSREPSKGGFSPEELLALADQVVSLKHLRVDGLMTMAAYSDDPAACRPTFTELRDLRDELRRRTGLELPHLSMGMSNDYEVAIEEGATFIRLGTVLFDGLGAES